MFQKPLTNIYMQQILTFDHVLIKSKVNLENLFLALTSGYVLHIICIKETFLVLANLFWLS